MTDDRQYDLEEAIRLKVAGEALVAGNQQSEWRDGYVAIVEAWFSALTPKTTFIGEDIRKMVEPMIGQPSHPNAWGAMGGSMIRRWRKAGKIAAIGMRASTAKSSHACLCPLYEVQP